MSDFKFTNPEHQALVDTLQKNLVALFELDSRPSIITGSASLALPLPEDAVMLIEITREEGLNIFLMPEKEYMLGLLNVISEQMDLVLAEVSDDHTKH